MIRSAAAVSLLLLAASAASAQQVQYSSAHRDSERSIPQTVAPVTDAKVKSKLASNRVGTAVIVADFDADGTPDVISGYSTAAGGVLLLQRGSPAAHAPGPREWAMTASGEMVTPYKEKAEVIDTPVSPDLLATANFAGQGFNDLLVAAKGGSSLYVLYGHGTGAFTVPQALPLAGTISALTTWRSHDGQLLAVAGVCGSAGCGLQFINRTGETLAFVRTPAAVTSILAGRVDNGSSLDLAYVSNARAIVLDGDTALAPSPTTEKLPGGNVAALALGSFVTDRRGLTQVAVLSTDATLHVFTRAGLDTSAPKAIRNFKPAVAPVVKTTGQPWSEVETVYNVGSGGSPLMLRAHLFGGGNDDLAVLNGHQYVTVAHRRSEESGRNVTTPVVTIDSTSSAVTAAVPARFSADARSGMLLLSSGAHPLTVSLPGVHNVYNVNTTADGNHGTGTTGLCTSGITCTLRDAVNLANADLIYNSGHGTIDTINVPAGTYSLTVDNPTKGTTTPATYDMFGSYNFHLEMDAPMNIVGAGSASVIIDAGTRDQVLSMNQGVYNATSPTDYNPGIFDIFVSGVTIQNGTNPNSYNNASCSVNQYCNVEAGNIGAIMGNGTGSNIVFNNVVITKGKTTLPGVGGIVSDGGGAFDAYLNSSGTAFSGGVEFDNSTISNNTDQEGGGGGGVKIEPGVPLTLSNDIFTGNYTPLDGGGLQTINNDSTQVTIANSTFSSNIAVEFGGGAELASTATVTNTVFNANTGGEYGGGLLIYQLPYNASITGSTFTANSLNKTDGGGPTKQDGAGICISPSLTSTGNTVTFQYNRIHGNVTTLAGAANGLAIGCATAASPATYQTTVATNNWWGCNAAPNSAPCDIARKDNSGTSGTLTTTPYTVLAITNNGTVAYGNPITAVGGLYSNSAGTAYSGTAQLSAYTGLPASITITQANSSGNFQSGNTAATGKLTESATANSSGNGTATITLDGITVSSSFTVVAPVLNITSTHSGNFKAGDAGDTYALTVGNVGTSSTTSTVTVTDTLPTGFTATAISGTGWTCTLSPLSCNRSDQLSSSVTYPAITVTVSVGSTLAGTYTNNVQVSGGGSANPGNGTDNTAVVGQPTIAQAISPTSVAKGAPATVTFTLGNPSANSVSLTGVGFIDPLPSGLVVATPNNASTTCSGASVSAGPGFLVINVSGATIAAGATCTVTVNVASSTPATYTNTTQNVTATNANSGGTATASVTVTGEATTTAVSASSTSGSVGGTTTVGVKVTDTTTPANTPAGTVAFSNFNSTTSTTTALGSYTLVNGAASFTYNESYAGNNVITAIYTPASNSFNASQDTTGKTIVVTKATPVEVVHGDDQTIQRNVATNVIIILGFPGKVAPTGAITTTVNGTAIPGNPVCGAVKFGTNPHINCSYANYTTTLAPGQYTLIYSQAADSNYNAYSGTSTLTVIP